MSFGKDNNMYACLTFFSKRGRLSNIIFKEKWYSTKLGWIPLKLNVQFSTIFTCLRLNI